MPYAPRPGCRHPLCPNIAEQSSSYCSVHKQPASEYESSRENANKRGYNSRWQRARAIYLRAHPLCAQCLRNDTVTVATVIDHIKPHRGDYELFWDESNWESLCKRHHDIKTSKGQ